MSQGITPIRTNIIDEIDEYINKYMTVHSIQALARKLGTKKNIQNLKNNN